MEDVKLNFEGDHALLQTEFIKTGNPDGLALPINLYARKRAADPDAIYYDVTIDGVSWFTTESQMHAIILFDMLKKHVMEYMRYKSL